MHRYSLLTPMTGECDRELKAIIARLAKKHGAPLFEPHLTITSDINADEAMVRQQVAQLAKILQPTRLDFSEISFSSTYFQAVFVRVVVTAWLMELYIKSRELFGLSIAMFMPHISLLYGIPDMREREHLARSIQVKSTGFTADQFELMSYDPGSTDIANWTHLGRFQFGATT